MQKRLWKSLPRKRENCDSRQVQRVRINITQAPVETWATTGRPIREDSQLAGAFVVDPPGKVASDRIFVLGIWRSGSDIGRSQRHETPLPHMIPVINGKSWPYTERLTYTAGEPVRWRWINASDGGHPHAHARLLLPRGQCG